MEATKQEKSEEYVEVANAEYRAGGWRSRGGFLRGGGGAGSLGEEGAVVSEHGVAV